MHVPRLASPTTAAAQASRSSSGASAQRSPPQHADVRDAAVATFDVAVMMSDWAHGVAAVMTGIDDITRLEQGL